MRRCLLLAVLLAGCADPAPQNAQKLSPLILLPPLPEARRLLTTAQDAIVLPPVIFTNTLTLRWDQPDDPSVVQYNLYHGTNSGTYFENWLTDGLTNQLTVTVTRSRGTRHFFVVTSVAADSTQSLFSNEVMWPRYSTNILVTNVVICTDGPFPVTLFSRSNLFAGDWQAFTNLTATNSTLSIEPVEAKFFMSTNRFLSIRLP